MLQNARHSSPGHVRPAASDPDGWLPSPAHTMGVRLSRVLPSRPTKLQTKERWLTNWLCTIAPAAFYILLEEENNWPSLFLSGGESNSSSLEECPPAWCHARLEMSQMALVLPQTPSRGPAEPSSRGAWGKWTCFSVGSVALGTGGVEGAGDSSSQEEKMRGPCYFWDEHLSLTCVINMVLVWKSRGGLESVRVLLSSLPPGESRFF